jgi:C4-dicarboxylate transporter, DctQ subunit
MLWRAYDWLLNALSAVCAALILAMMAGVALDVTSRYFFGSPIAWMFELTEYALLYVPCLGMAWLARERGHVAIDGFVSRLPQPAQRAMFVVTTAATAAVCGLVAYWGAIVTVDRFRRATVVEHMIRTPEYLIVWVIPFGFALAAVAFARILLVDRKSSSSAD